MRRKLSVQLLLLSFLKYHRAHLKELLLEEMSKKQSMKKNYWFLHPVSNSLFNNTNTSNGFDQNKQTSTGNCWKCYSKEYEVSRQQPWGVVFNQNLNCSVHLHTLCLTYGSQNPCNCNTQPLLLNNVGSCTQTSLLWWETRLKELLFMFNNKPNSDMKSP